MLASYLRGSAFLLVRLRPPRRSPKQCAWFATEEPNSGSVDGYDILWEKKPPPQKESARYRRHRKEINFTKKKKVRQRHRNIRKQEAAAEAYRKRCRHGATSNHTKRSAHSSQSFRDKFHEFPGDWDKSKSKQPEKHYSSQNQLNDNDAMFADYVDSGNLDKYYKAWSALRRLKQSRLATDSHLAKLLRTCYSSDEMQGTIYKNMNKEGRNDTQKIPFGKEPYTVLAEQYIIEGELHKAKKLIDDGSLEEKSSAYVSDIIQKILNGQTEKYEGLVLQRLRQWRKEGTIEGLRHALRLVSEPALYFEQPDAPGHMTAKPSPKQWGVSQPDTFFEELQGIFRHGHGSSEDILDMIENGMPASGLVPDASMYVLLARQYVIEGDMEMAEDVLHEHMQAAGISPSPRERKEIAEKLIRIDIQGIDSLIRSAEDLRDLIEVGLGTAEISVWDAKLHDEFDLHDSPERDNLILDQYDEETSVIGSILAELKRETQRSGHIVLYQDEILDKAGFEEAMDRVLSPRGMQMQWDIGDAKMPGNCDLADDFTDALQQIDSIWLEGLRREAWLVCKSHDELGRFRWEILKKLRRENTIASKSRARKFFQQLVDNGEANVYHYNVMAGLLMMSGEDVVSFLQEHQEKSNFTANTATYNSMIHAHMIEGDRVSANQIEINKPGGKSHKKMPKQPRNTEAILCYSDNADELEKVRTTIFWNCKRENQNMSNHKIYREPGLRVLSQFDPILLLSGDKTITSDKLDEKSEVDLSEPHLTPCISPRHLSKYGDSSFFTAVGVSPKDRALRLVRRLTTNGIPITERQKSCIAQFCITSKEWETIFPKENYTTVEEFNYLLRRLKIEGDEAGIQEVTQNIMGCAGVQYNLKTHRILNMGQPSLARIRARWLHNWLADGTRESHEQAKSFFASLEQRNQATARHYEIMQRWNMTAKQHYDLVFKRMPHSKVYPSEANFAYLVQQLILEGQMEKARSIINIDMPKLKKNGKLHYALNLLEFQRMMDALKHFVDHKENLYTELREVHLRGLLDEGTYAGLVDAAQFLSDMTENEVATSTHYGYMIKKVQQYGYGGGNVGGNNVRTKWNHTYSFDEPFSDIGVHKQNTEHGNATTNIARHLQLAKDKYEEDSKNENAKTNAMNKWHIRDSSDILRIIETLIIPAGITINSLVWSELLAALALEGNTKAVDKVLRELSTANRLSYKTSMWNDQNVLSARRTGYMKFLVKNSLCRDGIYFFDNFLMKNNVANVDQWNLRLKWTWTSEGMQRMIDEYMTGRNGIHANLQTYVILIEQKMLEGDRKGAEELRDWVLGRDCAVSDDADILHFDIKSTPVLAALFDEEGISDHTDDVACIWHMNASREFIRNYLDSIIQFPCEQLSNLRVQFLEELRSRGDEKGCEEFCRKLQNNGLFFLDDA